MRNLTDYLLAAACLVAAVMLARAGAVVRSARRQGSTRDNPVLWWTLAAIFALFALVKACNGLAIIGSWMRETAKSEGLYPERRAVQYLALGLMCMGAVVGGISLATHRGLAKRHWFMLTCTALIALFAATRFISLHAVDAWFAEMPLLRPAGELILIGAVTVCALRRINTVNHRQS